MSSVFYWSGGSGGGTGTYGSVSRMPAVAGERWYLHVGLGIGMQKLHKNSDNIDENFSTTENRSTGILRNSINRQDTYGLISKLNYVVNPELELQFGLDWRNRY